MLMSDENLKQGTCITNPNYGIMNPEQKKKKAMLCFNREFQISYQSLGLANI